MFKFTETDKINHIIREGAASRLTDMEFVENEISRFKKSKRCREMLDGIRYFEGKHDILDAERTAIGESGIPEPVQNLPNNKIIDNQYKKMVTQKTNYMLGQPVVFTSENKTYDAQLKEFFGSNFCRLLKNVGKDSLNCGIGWVYINYNDNGELILKRFRPYEVIPGWRDKDHTDLDYAIRAYKVISYEGKKEKTIEKVEIYEPDGIHYFTRDNGKLIPDEVPYSPYFYALDNEGVNQAFNWSKIPLIPFKANDEEIPLIRNVKSLQDGINRMLSTFQNNMEEDARNTILVLVNYDGENLGEFRRNLATYGVVKVRNTQDSSGGDLKSLQVEVNAENYKAIVELFKKALIENAMGYDAKDDRVGANANQMNIQSMYNDIDLDTNEMETEYQASIEELLWFFKAYLSHTSIGNFDSETAKVIFNRDMMMNESEIIQTLNSDAILSIRTKLEQHPWIDDVNEELERLKAEAQETLDDGDDYKGSFKPKTEGGGVIEQ